MRYEVTMSYETSITVEVEANSPQDAKQAAVTELETNYSQDMLPEMWPMDFAPTAVQVLPAPWEYESAVIRIHQLLSGNEWDGGTIEAVAFIIENIGEGEFHIVDSGDVDSVVTP